MKTFFSKDTKDRIDIHCHILPEIDDGSQSLSESIEMLRSAKDNGITDIVATPHVRDRDFDFDYAYERYEELKPYAEALGMGLHLGFEVNCEALIEFEFKNLKKMCIQNSDSFLLEFKNFSLPPNWQLIIKKLQAEGLQVIIAHPERYDFVQRDLRIAEELVNMGCCLQCDSYVFDLNRFDRSRKAAYRMMDRHIVSWIASDSHAPGHFDGYREIIDDLGHDLIRNSIDFDY